MSKWVIFNYMCFVYLGVEDVLRAISSSVQGLLGEFREIICNTRDRIGVSHCKTNNLIPILALWPWVILKSKTLTHF